VLKNALDWVSRAYLLTPLALKPVAIMGATKGNGGTSQAQTNLRQLLFSLNMEPVNRPVLQVSQAHTKFDEAGQFTDAHGKEILEKLVHNLAAKVVKHKNEQQEAAASASR
jgi:chromate reductase